MFLSVCIRRLKHWYTRNLCECAVCGHNTLSLKWHKLCFTPHTLTLLHQLTQCVTDVLKHHVHGNTGLSVREPYNNSKKALARRNHFFRPLSLTLPGKSVALARVRCDGLVRTPLTATTHLPSKTLFAPPRIEIKYFFLHLQVNKYTRLAMWIVDRDQKGTWTRFQFSSNKTT